MAGGTCEFTAGTSGASSYVGSSIVDENALGTLSARPIKVRGLVLVESRMQGTKRTYSRNRKPKENLELRPMGNWMLRSTNVTFTLNPLPIVKEAPAIFSRPLPSWSRPQIHKFSTRAPIKMCEFRRPWQVADGVLAPSPSTPPNETFPSPFGHCTLTWCAFLPPPFCGFFRPQY